MYCVKCGVKLSDGQTVCPLCETAVYHPDIQNTGKPTYPKKDFKSEAFNKKGLMFVITILFLIPLLLPLILDLSWHNAITWSGYVFGGVLLFYVSIVLPSWFKNPNPAIFVPSTFAALTVYLLYICLSVGGKWFLGFAMPVTLSLGAIFTAALTLSRYIKKAKLYIAGGSFIAFGIWTTTLEFLIRRVFDVSYNFYWSFCTLALFFIVGMLLIIIEIVKPIKESLRKIFFIG